MDLSDRELLARTLVAEAGLEGPQGMLAAGSVIMNRAAGGGYGDGVRGVILKPGQFSAWNGITGYAGGKGANDIVNRSPTDQAYQIADTLLGGGYDDPTGGATHYYAPKYANPAWGMSAGGDWAKIGGHVFGKADAGRGSYTAPRRAPQGGGTMREPTTQQRNPMVSTQGAAPERKGLFNPDVRDRLIVALEGMTLNPNQALMGQASQGIADRRKEATDEKARNRTLEWLKNSGLPNADVLIGAVASGALSSGEAARAGISGLQAKQVADNDPNVQSSQMLPDQSGTVFNMRDGTLKVMTVGGETLTGDAATTYVREAQQRGADIERSKYYSRGAGGLDAKIEQGGAAKAAEKGGELTTERAFEAYDQAIQAGRGVATIDEAIAALDGGAQSGIVYNMLPNVTEASAALENAMNRMGLDVISSVTFGALSEGEMKLAMETAVPRNLKPEDLKRWLQDKRDAQVKAREALLEAARYLSTPGNTIGGWMDQQTAKPAAPPPDSGINDEDKAFMRGLGLEVD